MRFLVSFGGKEEAFGSLVSPGTYGIPGLVRSGYPWAGDNQAYTQKFDPIKYFNWLETMLPFKKNCLFVSIPDVVGDAIQTLDNYRYWVRYFEGWPVAFVAQDGQESLRFPDYYDAIFIGGTTEWKESDGAIYCIKKAQEKNRHIHIGRINTWRRYSMFRILEGSDTFTCDGTKQRFFGREKALKLYQDYESRPPLIRI